MKAFPLISFHSSCHSIHTMEHEFYECPEYLSNTQAEVERTEEFEYEVLFHMNLTFYFPINDLIYCTLHQRFSHDPAAGIVLNAENLLFQLQPDELDQTVKLDQRGLQATLTRRWSGQCCLNRVHFQTCIFQIEMYIKFGASMTKLFSGVDFCRLC